MLLCRDYDKALNTTLNQRTGGYERALSNINRVEEDEKKQVYHLERTVGGHLHLHAGTNLVMQRQDIAGWIEQ